MSPQKSGLLTRSAVQINAAVHENVEMTYSEKTEVRSSSKTRSFTHSTVNKTEKNPVAEANSGIEKNISTKCSKSKSSANKIVDPGYDLFENQKPVGSAIDAESSRSPAEDGESLVEKDGQIIKNVSKRVAKTVDAYLGEIATDVDLKVCSVMNPLKLSYAMTARNEGSPNAMTTDELSYATDELSYAVMDPLKLSYATDEQNVPNAMTTRNQIQADVSLVNRRRRFSISSCGALFTPSLLVSG
ncbi:unnamed protein product [Fraxinus pennsylvanica]|uniref:Uncharacterized protein n=1 Tax=Fraxinus pennsylvanica TaxID=56036 RepID=A0AAD2DIM3_9LAMI|nr:unnamed protein product [Fraxinus pennsylvanica]